MPLAHDLEAGKQVDAAAVRGCGNHAHHAVRRVAPGKNLRRELRVDQHHVDVKRLHAHQAVDDKPVSLCEGVAAQHRVGAELP